MVLAFIITILMIIFVNLGNEYFGREKIRKHQREYQRRYRAGKRNEELRQLRIWRRNIKTKVRDWRTNKIYYLKEDIKK